MQVTSVLTSQVSRSLLIWVHAVLCLLEFSLGLQWDKMLCCIFWPNFLGKFLSWLHFLAAPSDCILIVSKMSLGSWGCYNPTILGGLMRGKFGSQFGFRKFCSCCCKKGCLGDHLTFRKCTFGCCGNLVPVLWKNDFSLQNCLERRYHKCYFYFERKETWFLWYKF